LRAVLTRGLLLVLLKQLVRKSKVQEGLWIVAEQVLSPCHLLFSISATSHDDFYVTVLDEAVNSEVAYLLVALPDYRHVVEGKAFAVPLSQVALEVLEDFRRGDSQLTEGALEAVVSQKFAEGIFKLRKVGVLERLQHDVCDLLLPVAHLEKITDDLFEPLVPSWVGLGNLVVRGYPEAGSVEIYMDPRVWSVNLLLLVLALFGPVLVLAGLGGSRETLGVVVTFSVALLTFSVAPVVLVDNFLMASS
jgi:hypothetical protein